MMIYDRDCKISDLIKKLNFIQREHGDVEVRLYDSYMKDYYNFALEYDDKECTCNVIVFDEQRIYDMNNVDDKKYEYLKGPSDIMFFRMPKSIDP